MGGKEQKRPEPLFDMGELAATPGAINVMAEAKLHPSELLLRHVTGDWGDLDEEDKKENDLSLEKGYRILSSYMLDTGEKLWIITEADRSATTILRPDEY